MRASRDAWGEMAAAQERLGRSPCRRFSVRWFEDRVGTLAFRAAGLILTAHARQKQRLTAAGKPDRARRDFASARSCRGRGGIRDLDRGRLIRPVDRVPCESSQGLRRALLQEPPESPAAHGRGARKRPSLIEQERQAKEGQGVDL
jgi:hypothetical protein